MYNKYELVSCQNMTLLSIFNRYYVHEGYKIIAFNNNVLFVKKVISNDYLNPILEQNIIHVINDYSHKYYYKKFIHIDFTSTIKEIKDIAHKNNNVLKINDANITWRIRQAFTKAISKVYEKEIKEYA